MKAPNRREFIKIVGAASLAAGTALHAAKSNNNPIIQDVIDKVIMECTGKPLDNTVDTVKTGDPQQPVKGIAVTFLATCDIIDKAADAGCNFIITHEPTFYSHQDETDWLQNDPVYKHKAELAKKHNMVIWRCHDYIHSHRPDGILEGMVAQLGWGDYQSKDMPVVFNVPSMSLKQLAEQLKSIYHMPSLLAVGDPDMQCKKIAFSMGAPGGRSQIMMSARTDADVLICGEINEWEPNIYIKDAIHSGRKTAMIILGHRFSEEAGMLTVEKWVNGWYPEIKTQYLPVDEPFQYI